MKKNILIPCYSLLVLLWLASCTKNFDELRDNPNAPGKVPAEYLLPSLIKRQADLTVNIAYTDGNQLAQYTAAWKDTDFDRYDWHEVDYQERWDQYYKLANDANNLLESGRQTRHTGYEGVALIFNSLAFASLTDLFGDIPYSESLQQREGTFQPRYDTQEAVYDGILADLARANDLLALSTSRVNGDILYGGDLTRWRKLANSLRLRYLLRLSAKKNVAAEMAAIVNDRAKYPLFGNVKEEAALHYLEKVPNAFPIYDLSEEDLLKVRMSTTSAALLFPAADPRLAVFFSPTPASRDATQKVYAGLPNGLPEQEAARYNGGSDHLSTIGEYFYQSPNGAKAVLMSYAELCFILAEASQKGLIAGDAEKHYYDGIAASMEHYGITADPQFYTRTGVTYTPARALEQIGVQKWIALYFCGMEGWIEWRRTGWPALKPPAANANGNCIPVRYRYPPDEYKFNAGNVASAVARQGADEINTKMWLNR